MTDEEIGVAYAREKCGVHRGDLWRDEVLHDVLRAAPATHEARHDFGVVGANVRWDRVEGKPARSHDGLEVRHRRQGHVVAADLEPQAEAD